MKMKVRMTHIQGGLKSEVHSMQIWQNFRQSFYTLCVQSNIYQLK